ncbi:DUF4349 domain-containing protein [Candidatus Poriferisodalis sp.]|uniref:DUF4349 domain-containing protein n=1 Tax=Candidatus Poriferisodalis sp. TaxID=3101277 RepID=UPI003B02958C
MAAALLVLMIAACSTDSDDEGMPGSAASTAEHSTATESFAASLDEADSDDAGYAVATMAESSDDMADAAHMDDGAATPTDSVSATDELQAANLRPAAGDDAQPREGSHHATPSALGNDTAAVPAAAGREIIYEAAISVESVDVAAAAAEATAIIRGLGGITFGQQTSTRGAAYTTLTFKLAPAHFDAALEQLSAVGELVNRTVSAEDVTEVVVDLDSRIRTAALSVERLREFLAQTTDMEGVAEIERELAQRETSLERLRGQLRTIRERVDLATIKLTISEATEAVPTASLILRAWLADGEDDPCLGSDELVAPPAGVVGFCFELENDGEAALTDVTLSSEALRFDAEQLVVTSDTGLERIEPGQRVVATLAEEIADGRIAGRVVTRGLNIDVRARAVPIADDGTELAGLARAAALELYVEPDNSPPSFGDAVRGGAGALVAVGNGVLLVIGALLPFLPVMLVVAATAWWWRHRRSAAHASGSANVTTDRGSA